MNKYKEAESVYQDYLPFQLDYSINFKDFRKWIKKNANDGIDIGQVDEFIDEVLSKYLASKNRDLTSREENVIENSLGK